MSLESLYELAYVELENGQTQNVIKLVTLQPQLLSFQNKSGNYLLSAAIRLGNNEVFDAFLQLGQPLELVNNSGHGFLHIATIYNRVKMLETLIKYGCHLPILDKKGQNPLTIALANGNQRIINLLQGAQNPLNINFEYQNDRKNYQEEYYQVPPFKNIKLAKSLNQSTSNLHTQQQDDTYGQPQTFKSIPQTSRSREKKQKVKIQFFKSSASSFVQIASNNKQSKRGTSNNDSSIVSSHKYFSPKQPKGQSMPNQKKEQISQVQNQSYTIVKRHKKLKDSFTSNTATAARGQKTTVKEGVKKISFLRKPIKTQTQLTEATPRDFFINLYSTTTPSTTIENNNVDLPNLQQDESSHLTAITPLSAAATQTHASKATKKARCFSFNEHDGGEQESEAQSLSSPTDSEAIAFHHRTTVVEQKKTQAFPNTVTSPEEESCQQISEIQKKLPIHNKFYDKCCTTVVQVVLQEIDQLLTEVPQNNKENSCSVPKRVHRRQVAEQQYDGETLKKYRLLVRDRIAEISSKETMRTLEPHLRKSISPILRQFTVALKEHYAQKA